LSRQKEFEVRVRWLLIGNNRLVPSQGYKRAATPRLLSFPAVPSPHIRAPAGKPEDALH